MEIGVRVNAEEN